MSNPILDAWTGADPKTKARAAAIQDKAETPTRSSGNPILGSWTSARPEAIPTGSSAMPDEGETFDPIMSPEETIDPGAEPVKYGATTLAADSAKMAGAALVSGTAQIPLGVESAAKKTIRDVATGDMGNSGPMALARIAQKAMMNLFGMSYEEQEKSSKAVGVAVDKALSGAHIPGVQGLADYGKKVQQDIVNSISDRGKEALAGSKIEGNIFKGEMSFGENPTVAGYVLQTASVLGSLVPVIATALITKKPTAGAAVGGGMAAGEGYGKAQEYIANTPHDKLLEISPYYRELIDQGLPEKEARTIVTEKAGESAAVLQGLIAAFGDRITGKLVTGAYNDLLFKLAGKGAARRATVAGGANALKESGQEVTEGVGSDIGIATQIPTKEIGEGSAENAILGALGGGPVGAAIGSVGKPSNKTALAMALQEGVDSTQFNPEAIDRQVRASLDPQYSQEQRRSLAEDSVQDIADSISAEAAVDQSPTGDVTVAPPPDEQQQTAVEGESQTLEPGLDVAQAQQMSQPTDPNVAGTIDQNELEQMLQEVDQNNQELQNEWSQQSPPKSLTDAVEAISRDLQLPEGETISIPAVTNDTRLNKFSEALEKAFGVNFHWVDFGEEGLVTNTGRNLGRFNGYRFGDTVLVSQNASFMDTTWHELTHTLETKHPEVYSQLRNTILQTIDPAKKKLLYEQLNKRRMAEVGKPMGAAELESELVAVTVGEQATDPRMLEQLFDSFSDKSIAQQFKDVLVEILDKLAAALKGPQYIKDRQNIIRAREAIKTAFGEYQKREAAKAPQLAQPNPAGATLAQPQGTVPGALPPALAKIVAASKPNTTMTPALAQKVAASQGTAATQGQATEATTQPGATPKTGAFARVPEKQAILVGKFAEKTFLQAIEQYPEEMIQAYVDTHGRDVNPDLARELSPIYNMNPGTYAAAVHEPSSKLTKMVYDHLLKNANTANDIVRFMAGGGGSGKGYVRKEFGLFTQEVILYDAVMGKFSSAAARIEQALQANLKADLYYINTPAITAFKFAMIRAETRGRTVPIKVLAEAHTGAAATVKQLLKEFGNTVPFQVVNSSNNELTFGTIDDVPSYNQEELEREFNDVLNQAVDKGYSEELADGFRRSSFSRGIDWSDEQADRSILAERRARVSEQGAAPSQQPQQPTRAPAQTGQVTQAPQEARTTRAFSRPESIPTDTKEQQKVETAGQFDRPVDVQPEGRQYDLNIARKSRAVGESKELAREEIDALRKDAKKLGIGQEQLDDLTNRAIELKRRYPESDGWAPMFVTGIALKEDATIEEADVKWQSTKYGFNVPDGIGRAPNKLDEGWAKKVEDQFYKLIKDIYDRAESGDVNATIILSHQNWYRNVTEVLRREFGASGDLLADLLGATSPNTPVDTNWRFAIDILRRFVRGDFDKELGDFSSYLGDGGALFEYPSVNKIRQISGKMYGMNSGNAMLALVDAWRDIRAGQAPKARNFAKNLIGQSDMATIDVWAARMLRRAANLVSGNFLRIPPPAEQGVTGKWNANSTAVTGEFGFGAQVMQRVSERLKADGRDVSAPELQAIAWFAEKELWGENNWTTAAGEGGSFEKNIDAVPMKRFIAGWSIQQGERIPSKGDVSVAQATVMETLAREPGVVSARVVPTKGLYGGTVEDSFDTEWTVESDNYDPSMTIATIAAVAKDNNQYDIFVSEVLKPESENKNARPGVEIYFKTKEALSAAMPFLDQFTSRGVDGFTMAVDPRSKNLDGEYIGVRLQYVPEISMRWDEDLRQQLLQPGEIERVLLEKMQQLNDITEEVRRMEGVAYANTFLYDTIVIGKENYDAYTDRAASARDRKAGSEAWFGQPIREGLERAVARLNSEPRAVNQDNVSDVGGEEATAQSVKSVGQFSRASVEAAANEDPSAPDMFVINSPPAVLTQTGLPNHAVVIKARTVMKVVNPDMVGKNTSQFMDWNRAGYTVQREGRIPLTVDELRDIPKMMGDPVAVLKSASDPRYNRQAGYKLIVDLVKGGNPVMVVVHSNIMQKVTGPKLPGKPALTNEIASVYPVNSESTLRNLDSEISSNNLVYLNRGKAAALRSKIGTKLPALSRGSFGSRVRGPEQIKSRVWDKHPASEFARDMLEDMQLQQEFLTNRAEEAGFNDLDGWINSDYDGFIRAAESWRAQNPVDTTFDPNKPSINASRQIAIAGNQFNIGERTTRERLSNLFANEVSRVSDVQQQIAQQGGVLTEETNIENALHRMYGKAGNKIDRFRKNVLQPILEDAAKSNVSLDDVAAYLYANHATERNSYIRSINPAFKDGGSGMTNKDAADIIKNLQANPASFARIKRIADRLQDITNQTGRELLESGLIDQNTLDAWKANYKYYVPLQNFETVDPTTGNRKNNSGFDPRNPFFKRAMGRQSRAGLIVEQLLQDYERAVVNGERNKLRQAFLKFALQNKDPQLWVVDPMVLQKRFNKGSNLVDYALVKDEGGDTIGVRVNGVPRSIRIFDPGTLADMQMKPLFQTDDQWVKNMFGVWLGMNRGLSKLWTALSPAFVLTNAQRDLQFAIGGTAVERGVGAAVDIAKDFIPAAYAIMRAERNNNWGGNSELKAYYDMYREDGGKTGFMNLNDIETRQNQLIADYKNAQASLKTPTSYHRLAMRYMQNAEDFIMDINGGIENAARVAAYKSVIEQAGYTNANAPKDVRERAAIVAKNLTVNFNRRGKLTPLMGGFYLFFNPAVQGALRTGKLVFSKKGGMLAASLTALGYIVAEMASGAQGDDGDEYWRKDANRAAKLKNLLMFGPNGEQYSVPLAYGLGFFVNLGYALHDLKKGERPLKVAAFMRDSFFVHFSPLGAAENMSTFVAPTLLDPVIAVSNNRNEMGTPLMPQSFDETKPTSERYWTNTRGTLLQQFTSWVNEATGGSEAQPGKISVSPEQVKYVTTFATGGAGQFVKDVFNSIDLTLNVGPDAAMDKNAFPVLRSFYKRNTGRMDQSAFYENSAVVKAAKNELKLMDGDKPPNQNVIDRAKVNEAYADLAGMQSATMRRLSRIRKEEIEILDNKTMSRREQYLRLKQLDEERRAEEVEFNREFYGVERMERSGAFR